MTQHPPLAALVDRSDEPEIAAHLSDCPSCRARWRLLTSEPPEDLPGLEAARAAMARARQDISQHMSISVGREPFEEPEDLEVGQIVERYRVEDRIGRGGMGTVYRVRHVQLDSLHALKLLHRTSRSVRDRLVREGRAQSKLRHPNVVPVTDIVDLDGAPGLVMEFVAGPTLAKHLAREGRPPLPEADRLAVEIIRGVAAAHDAGIAHRDLKPANVLLLPTAEGLVAKVTDFGLARELAASDDLDLTRPDSPLGTPAYMAPEQIHDARVADARSDIFSLGAILYELVTGQQAFSGPDVVTIYDRVRAGDYTPAEQIVADLPERMRTAITRALSVDPEARFADCRELLSAWRGGVDAPSLGDPTTGAIHVTPKASWVRWILPVGGAAGLATAAVVLLSVLWPSPAPPGDPAASDATAAVAAPSAPNPSRALAERRLTAQSDDLQIYAVATAPDGESFAYTDGRGLWHQPIDGGTASLLLSGGAYHNVGFYPDGKRIIASGWRDGESGTWSLDADGSNVARLSDLAQHIVRLSPDGTRLAFTTRTGLWVSEVDGSNRVRIRSLSTSDTTLGLVWSPTGKHIASVHVPASGDLPWLEVSRVDGSATCRMVEHAGLASLSIAALAWVEPDKLLYVTSKHVEGVLQTTVHALDDASVALDGSATRPIHTWIGFYVLRLEPSADGTRFVTSRATTDHRTALLDVANPGVLRPPSDEHWSEGPVAWLGPDELLVRSDRGGGGLYAYDFATGQTKRLAKDSSGVLHASVIGDEIAMVRLNKHDKQAPVTVERMPRQGGEPRTVLSLGGPIAKTGTHDGLYVHCRGERCMASSAHDEGVRFAWIDPETGERGPPLVEVPLTAKWMRWDLSHDARELAVATSNPAKITVFDLETGAATEWANEIEFPQAVAWHPDGDALFASGLVDASEYPYRVVAVGRDGSIDTLWTSMAMNAYAIRPSPDGSTLALGIHAFDDDVWLVEGLLDGEATTR